MARKDFLVPPSILQQFEGARGASSRQYEDTDPHMLFALWDMEHGLDPERTLDEIEGAQVLYDKFRPTVSRRKH